MEEIERSFLDWSCEAVCCWLSTLLLSQDYSSHFKDHGITGSTLISLDREALDDMGVIDVADRLKILQQITSMRADLMTSGSASPTRRMTSPVKGRRFSGNMHSPHHSGGRYVNLGSKSPRFGTGVPSRQAVRQNFEPTRYVNIPISERNPRTSESRTSIMNSPSQLSTDQTSSDSSRISSPDKLHEVDLEEKRDLNYFSKLQTVATMRYHNVKRLSRSVGHLFSDGDDIFSVYNQAAQAVEKNDYSSNSCLVEILREENASLKQELETYYQRVRKLQKIEQEVEHIREAHQMLESSAMRREGLEKSLRVKLEQEIWRLKEENICIKAELKMARNPTSGDTPSEKNTSSKHELRRRDTMIMRLIKQNEEAAITREQLEKDLQSTKAQLKENKHTNTEGGPVSASVSDHQINSESDIALAYSESIEKLRAVLSTMQSMSQKRESLEKKLRSQLEGEIRRLKQETVSEVENDTESNIAENLIQNASLEADVVKWEHKCLELVAEKQMTIEAVVIPKEARIAALERSLAEKMDRLNELQKHKSVYIAQLTEANRKNAELEIELTSAQYSLQEKDSVIQMMQKSFLEPEDELLSHTHHAPPPPPNTLYPKQSSERSAGHSSLSSSGNFVESASSLPSSSVLSSSSSFSSQNDKISLPSKTQVKSSPLASPVVHHINSRSKSTSPTKVLIGNSGLPKGTAPGNPFTNYTREISNKKNGYHHRSAPARYIATTTKNHSQFSDSASNSPRVQNPSRKPRISHPNLRLMNVSGPDSSGYRNHAHNKRKSNTGPGGTRRGNYKHLPSPRAVKSKTPPPDYKLVSTSAGRKNSKAEPPKLPPKKQRYKSAENILERESESKGSSNHDVSWYRTNSLDLFQSLVGDDTSAQDQTREWCSKSTFVHNSLGKGFNSHKHSISSPTNKI